MRVIWKQDPKARISGNHINRSSSKEEDNMKLYKYLSDKTFHDHLDSHLRGEVHLSSWRDFNDPMEGFFIYIANGDQQQAVDAVVGKKSKFRVSCFCKSYKKFLLWSYYTNKHRGVCLEFEVHKKRLPANCILESIVYSPTLPQFDANANVDDQAKRFLLTKMTPWKQEGEVRLLGHNLSSDTISFGRLIGIIFGVNYSQGDSRDQTRQRVVHAVRDLGQSGPELYQAVIEGDSPEIQRRVFDRYEQNQFEVN